MASRIAIATEPEEPRVVYLLGSVTQVLQTVVHTRMKELRRQTGLILLIIACLIGPALTQLLIAYAPFTSKGVFSSFEAIGSRSFHSGYQLVYQPELTVSGRILPPRVAERVSLEINGEPYTGSVRADDWGGFWAQVPLHPYENTVVAYGPWGTRASVSVLYLPERDRDATPPPVPRELSVTLSPQQAAVTYTVIYQEEAASSQDLIDLSSGAIGADLFVKLAFYPDSTRFSGSEFLALSKSPDFAVHGDTTVVTVSGVLAQQDYTTENVRHVLEPTLQVPDVPSAPTTITLSLDRVELLSPPGPWPDTWEEDTLQWVDPAGPVTIEYEQEAAPWSDFALLRSLWTGLQAAMGQVNRALETAILPVAPVVPFLWLLFQRSLRRLNDEGVQGRRRTLFWLALVMWVVPVSAFVIPFALIAHGALEAVGFPVPLLPRYPAHLSLWASSVSYCLLLPLAYRFSTRQGSAGRGKWPRWLGLILGAIFLSGCCVLLEGYISKLLFPMASLVLLVWIWLACELYRPGKSQLWRTFGSWPARIGLIAVLALLAYPLSTAIPTSSPAVGWQPRHWTQFYFIFGFLLLPYVVFAGLAPSLKVGRSDRIPPDRARARRLLGRLLFGVFVVGLVGAGASGAQWIAFSLIPFLVAVLWVYPGLIERASKWDLLRSVYARDELDDRPAGTTELRRKQWEARREAERRAEEARGGLPRRYEARRAVFAFGPIERPWENAKLSCFYALILSVLLFLAYSPLLLERAEQLLNTPFPLLQILGVLVLPFFARWLAAGFILGYFFPYIRGSNGLQKGLVLAIGTVASTLPSNLLVLGGTMGSLLALVWDAGQTILILTVLGLWAFDLNTAKRYGLGWNEVLRVHGLSFLLPYLSSVGGAIGLAVTSLITGRAEDIVRSALELMLKGALPLIAGGS